MDWRDRTKATTASCGTPEILILGAVTVFDFPFLLCFSFSLSNMRSSTGDADACKQIPNQNQSLKFNDYIASRKSLRIWIKQKAALLLTMKVRLAVSLNLDSILIKCDSTKIN
jgi:hypothetical protein